jgi:hypothetical protein
VDGLDAAGQPFLLGPPRQHLQRRPVDVQAKHLPAAQAGQFQRGPALAAADVEDARVIQFGQHLECLPGEVKADRAGLAQPLVDFVPDLCLHDISPDLV